MMVCTAFLMDSIAAQESHTIYPFVHHIVSNRCRDDQVGAHVGCGVIASVTPAFGVRS